MKPFKFFDRRVNGSLDTFDAQVFSTASLTDGQRIVETLQDYHNQRAIQGDEQNRLQREMLMVHERARRERNEVERIGEEQYRIRLANVTRVTTVNPTFKTKLKIFGTQVKMHFIETFRSEPIGTTVAVFLASLVTFIGIMKLLGH